MITPLLRRILPAKSGPRAPGIPPSTTSAFLYRSALLVFLCLSFFTLGFGPPKLVESDREKLPVYPYQLLLLSKSQPPELAGTAALVMDVATGRVAYQRNAHQRLAPASITKVMTAIVTLESGRLNELVEVKPSYLVEGSSMGLQPGDRISIEDLLWGLLLPSGNDSAMALAEHIGGSVERFSEMMNQKARFLGLQNTHFTNPHGLDEDDHYSSAYDIALMSRYALGLPLLARIVATQEKTVVTPTRAFLLHNTNGLLGLTDLVPGVDGVKTGVTEKAGDSMVASATRGGHRIIAVVLGTRGRSPAAAQLINYAFSQFAWSLLEPPLHPYVVDARGKQRPVGFLEPRQEMLPQWQAPYLVRSLRFTKDGDKNTQPIGYATYLLGDVPLASTALYVQAAQAAAELSRAPQTGQAEP